MSIVDDFGRYEATEVSPSRRGLKQKHQHDECLHHLSATEVSPSRRGLKHWQAVSGHLLPIGHGGVPLAKGTETHVRLGTTHHVQATEVSPSRRGLKLASVFRFVATFIGPRRCPPREGD